MTSLTVSVVVVSLGRPDHLGLCLTGLSQQLYPNFEIVVVTDAVGIDLVETSPLQGRIKTVEFAVANISAARNLGIRAAAGEIVAFIDDDAVPEPLWLARLVAPLSEPDVALTGGFVLGRNGISLQWGARSADRLCRHMSIDVDPEKATVLSPTPDTAIKTEGTNMAGRWDVLSGLGGFDETFHFYADETDLNMRAAQAGLATAIVPRAVVHHAFAASSRRRADRAPLDLTEIGASRAVFLRKWANPLHADRRLHEFGQQERLRLLKMMVDGALEPADVRRLMRQHSAGIAQGLRRSLEQLAVIERGDAPFLSFGRETNTWVHRVIGARRSDRRDAEAKARAAVLDGDIVSLFILSGGRRRHRVSFHADGYWLQTGGLSGQSLRDEPVGRFELEGRIRREIERVAPVRTHPHRHHVEIL